MALIRKSPYFSSHIKFASIDIGFNNLGIVWGRLNLSYTRIYFDKFELVDLFTVNAESSCSSGYSHTVDKMKEKFCKKGKEYFKDEDYIFIEYQPLSGLRTVQEFLVMKFEKKVHFAHPKAMHKHFKISSLDYEMRKCWVSRHSTSYMNLNFFKDWLALERKHDISDAMCIALFKIRQLKKDYKKKNKKRR